MTQEHTKPFPAAEALGKPWSAGSLCVPQDQLLTDKLALD